MNRFAAYMNCRALEGLPRYCTVQSQGKRVKIKT